MVKDIEVLAIIPARGGSKGIPGKNIKDFAGFPLLSYSIVAGQKSDLVTRVIVSTDSKEIAEIAKKFGAEVPFLRPGYLAEDKTLDYPVLKHCLEWLAKNEDYHPDILVWLRPTSPIRPTDCVDEVVKLLMSHPEADCVRGVVDAQQNPFKMWTIEKKTGFLEPLLRLEGIEEPYNAPRQSLPQVYWQTGHIDALWSKTIHEKSSMTGEIILPYLIDSRFSVDIDIPADWRSSEEILQKFKLDMVDPAKKRRKFPERVRLIILDFDGVMTDNRVWINDQGHEMVAANRSDSLGIEKLMRETDIKVLVLSRETNPVVTVRCEKLGLPVFQAILDKEKAVKKIINDYEIDPAEVIFMGNDINDVVAFSEVGFSIAPADAHQEVLRCADCILSADGGNGAIRELCDMIISRKRF